MPDVQPVMTTTEESDTRYNVGEEGETYRPIFPSLLRMTSTTGEREFKG